MIDIQPTQPIAPDPAAARFYVDVMRTLDRAEVPYVVGGGFAMAHYTGIARNTKDLDLFLKPSDRDRAMSVLSAQGFRTEFFYEFWIAKAVAPDGAFVDLLYNSGNGVCVVDDDWISYAVPADVLGYPTRLVPVEEQIWSKAFVMDRDRYDGGDIHHLILGQGERMDWPRLIERFGDGHERVLLAHLMLFSYAFPSERGRVPAWVWDDLHRRIGREAPADPGEQVCRGPFLAHKTYTVPVREWGFADGRLIRHGGKLSADQVDQLPQA